ncbi:MAG TPA: ankyrin repeat domain-containing protein [Gemmatimonadaceae bacterium]|nr:ankyrin repeat domain-containing protein [Gemmatimonadaceae bacterium]
MSSDPTRRDRTDTPALARILIPLDWMLWGALVVASIVSLVWALTDTTYTPEAGSGLGALVALIIALLVAAAGAALTVAARKRSVPGLIVVTVLLLWPGALLLARPIVLGYRSWSRTHSESKVGDFEDPILAAMARAIEANDTAALSHLLGDSTPSMETDRAGNDILAYSLIVLRDSGGGAEPVRILLDAGADPTITRMGNGEDVIGYFTRSHSHEMHHVMRLLLEHGADPNVVDPESGNTPLGEAGGDPELVRLLVEHGADIDRIQSNGIPAVVHFIGDRQWESALYLIEAGANLELKNDDGLSVDYYLEKWKTDVNGEHPDGWEKVRAAIAARRGMSEGVRCRLYTSPARRRRMYEVES